MDLLLERQLKKYGVDITSADAQVRKLFAEIDAVYTKCNLDRSMLERSLELTSQELSEKYDQLREDTERYETLYTSSGDAIMISEPPLWKFTAGNPATLKMFRAKDEKEFTSATPQELSPQYQPDGTPSSQKAKKMIMQAMKNGSNFFEWTHRRFDGEEFPATVLLTRMELGGKNVLQASVRDITERKKTEDELARSREAYKQIIDNAPLPIVVQRRGITLYANAKAQELTGYSNQEIVGQSIDRQLDPASRRLVREAISRTMRGRPSSGGLTVTLVRKNGERRLVRAKDALIDYEGEPATIAMLEDITEIAKAEKTVKEYTQKLEDEVLKRTAALATESDRVRELSAVKDEFIRNITHELKTPLSVILGSISLLGNMDPNRLKERRELTELLKRNGLRLAESIDQVLNLTRLETAELHKENIPLRQLANEVHEQYKPLADAKGIYLTVQGDGAAVSADRHLLQMALSNLVSNAVKFTSRGGVRIRVAGKGKNATISVSDTGIGISKVAHKKVFVKFFKSDPTAPGTGIGLASVKQIVEKHGGKISFNSIKNKGSVFVITLPTE